MARPPTGILSAAAMTAGLLTATAAPASAAVIKCNYDGYSFNATPGTGVQLLMSSSTA
jgi:hypothetical protein